MAYDHKGVLPFQAKSLGLELVPQRLMKEIGTRIEEEALEMIKGRKIGKEKRNGSLKRSE